MQLLDIINDGWQILEYQGTFRIRKSVPESLKIMASTTTNIHKQRSILSGLAKAIQENDIDVSEVEPLNSVHPLSHHQIVEVRHLLWMFHQPRKHLQFGIEGTLEVSHRSFWVLK